MIRQALVGAALTAFVVTPRASAQGSPPGNTQGNTQGPPPVLAPDLAPLLADRGSELRPIVER